MATNLDIPLSADVRRLLDALAADGRAVAVVGGAVRDAVMGREVRDIDVAADATTDEVRAACEGSAWCRSTYAVGERFGTVGVALADGSVVEISRFRGDGIESDAGHRDFTVNALAVLWPSGELVDAYGGQNDIARRMLRAPGDPAERFAEDALRVLRAARFAAELGFAPEPATAAAATGAAPRLAGVAVERVRDELTRTLLAGQADEGLATALRIGALDVVLPEVAALAGISQPTFHDLDVFSHTLQCVANTPATRVLRWAALLHDVGKEPCRSVEDDGRIRFLGHAQQGALIAATICDRLRLPKAEARAIVHLVATHMRLGELDPDNPRAVDRAVRRLDLWEPDAAAPKRLVSAEDALELTLADFAATAHRAEVDAVRSRLASAVAASRERGTREPVRPLLSGRELIAALGIAEGPLVGVAMRAIEDAIETGTLAPGDRRAALEVARQALPGEP